VLTLANAKALAAAALEKAAEIGKPVSVCVLDGRGLVVYLERQDGAPPFTSSTAEGKAAGSAFTGRPSASLAQMAQTNVSGVLAISARLGGRFTAAQGALPLFRGDECIGAIGVSGALAEEDEECARAAVEKVRL
jgi:glc operon protein GlcG